MGERFTNAIQKGPAIHSEALSGDPEGFGDRRIAEPPRAGLNGVDAPPSLRASRVSVNDIVKDDPFGYAEALPSSASVNDKQR